MPTKGVNIEVDQRAETGEINATHSAYGTTEDEGVTVIIPNGYVPIIETAPITDVRMSLVPPVEPLSPVSLVSRTNDVEANTSTLVFSYE